MNKNCDPKTRNYDPKTRNYDPMTLKLLLHKYGIANKTVIEQYKKKYPEDYMTPSRMGSLLTRGTCSPAKTMPADFDYLMRVGDLIYKMIAKEERRNARSKAEADRADNDGT